MAINQISTANTFEQRLIATQSLIAFANSITNAAPGGTFTSNTSEYIITGNLTLGNTITCTTVNTDVIIFTDGTRLSSNVSIVNSYNHANGSFTQANAAFNKANSANVLAQQAYDYANTIAIGGEIAGDNVQVLYAVIGNTINANISISTANITVTSNVTTSNITVSNNITVTKNVATGNLNSTGAVTGATATITGNVAAGNINSTGAVTGATATITGNLSSANVVVTNNVSSGNITVTNAITTTNITATLVSATDFDTTSDVALKDNMQQITNSLDILEKITGFTFNWKSDGRTSYGVSAQEVEKILPEAVRMRDDGYRGVNYLNLIAFLIEAIKDLRKEVMEIKNNNK